MTELLLTHVEQSQPYDSTETRLHLYGRDANNPLERREVVVTGFRPYFYVLAHEAKADEDWLLGQDCISVIDYGADEQPFGDDGELAKVYVPYPQDTRDARELFDHTWNADVPFTNRFLIDTGIEAYVEVPEHAIGEDSRTVDYSEIEPLATPSSASDPHPLCGANGLADLAPRTVTLDIEVDDRADGFPDMGQEKVLSIVAHDNYEDETAAFVTAEGRGESELRQQLGVSDDDELSLAGAGLDDVLDSLNVAPNESRMLRAFRAWFDGKDPDLITGWNVDGFDMPYLLARMENLPPTSADALSPLGYTDWDDEDATVKGRVVYDLLTIYKKNSYTELRSYTLDSVAEAELGAEKVQFEGGYYDLYERDLAKFLRYNTRDVSLVVDINEEAGVITFRDVLRREVGVMFPDSYNASDFIEMMCRRKLREQGKVGPTAEYAGSSDYEGAFVFDAYEGLAENVVGVDLSSLYPYTMAMANASPETKVEPGDDGTFRENCAKAPNDTYFRLDEDGLFRELVEDAISLKSEYKEKRDNADSDEEYEKWADKYASAKRITNCFTPDTEVLTPDGVTNITELAVGDPVYSLNPETGKMEVQPVTETHKYPDYDGDLVNIENQSTDFSVTPNHRMLARRNTGYVSEDGYSFIEAGKLKNSGGYEMPHGWETPGGEPLESVSLTEFLDESEYERDGQQIREPRDNCKWQANTYNGDDFLKLLAWYITEGNIYTSDHKEYNTTTRGVSVQINIAQETQEHRARIKTLLDRMGIDYYDSGRAFQIAGHGVLATVLTKLGGRGSADKKIPDLVFDSSVRQKETFFETLQMGDGDTDASRYSTKSKQLRDDVMRLCVETGRSPQYNKDSGVWRVYWDTGKSFRMGRDDSTDTATDGVYCVTVADNHTLLAGRNGKFQPVGQSIYGVTGWERFFLYDEDVAEAVTLLGQEVIKRTAGYIEDPEAGRGAFDVIYGDTDSTYVKFPDHWSRGRCLDVAREICDELNDEVYPEFATNFGIPAEDCLWDIEVEAYMKRYFQAGKKKRYAYLATWKDGREVADPKPSISGFSSQRSDSAALTEETEERVLSAILQGNPGEVSDIVFEAAQEITRTDPNWDRIGIPGGLQKKVTPLKPLGERDDYYTVSCDGDDCYPQDAHPRAAYNANEILGTNIGEGDKPMRVYVEPKAFDEVERQIDVIGFVSSEDLLPVEGELFVDVSRMQESLLVRPLERICRAIDVDVGAAIQGQTQTGLGAW